jgi:NitT/TauT family transport system permease protein/sulfonate transport system permease protein
MEQGSGSISQNPFPAAADLKPARAGFRLVVPVLQRLKHIAVIPAIFLVWELGVRLHWINGNIMPAPSATFSALIDLAKAGFLWRDIAASVERVVIGFGLAAVIGVSLALALGSWRTAAAYVLPVIELIRPISVLAWIPLAILWFGLGDHSAWFIIFLGSFFPIFTNTYLGACSVAPIHTQVAQCLGAGRWLYLRGVMFPSALPYIIAGLRVGLGVGWTCVIAAELIAATSGLGYMIQLARTMIETEKVMAGMIVIGIIGFIMNSGMLWLERRFIRWTPDHR